MPALPLLLSSHEEVILTSAWGSILIEKAPRKPLSPGCAISLFPYLLYPTLFFSLHTNLWALSCTHWKMDFTARAHSKPVTTCPKPQSPNCQCPIYENSLDIINSVVRLAWSWKAIKSYPSGESALLLDKLEPEWERNPRTPGSRRADCPHHLPSGGEVVLNSLFCSHLICCSSCS